MGIFSKPAIKNANESAPGPELFKSDTVTARNIEDLSKIMEVNKLCAKMYGAAAASTKLPDLKKEFGSIQKDHVKQASDILEFLKKEREQAE
ncbi:hypothetical protein SAMN04488127_2949 [Bhargavaea ginsengi]|uniref:Uncharacterized protein n=1 Tax=Bhargavaea ginsengi TaxID=426757 RepID=A0A1H7C116_9BACL|nr:hypothetical protein [Bhargavaea ginsengi]MCM3087733.1 hypothetical protein [Bhargavaea ginsengi]SEJ82964.1 hypothetical protein SAMN04488127_2949 [Bhargavaea ginsengi]